MIWKIFFVILVMLLTYLSFGGFAEHIQYTEINLFLSYVLAAIFVFAAGYFFSLGWKKKLFSLRANNIVFTFIMIYVVYCMIASVLGGLPAVVFEYKNQLAGTVSESSIYLSALLGLSLVSFVLYSVVYSPLVVAYFKYKKHYEEMKEVKKPYWKLFIVYSLFTILINLANSLFRVDFSMLNAWDYLNIFSVVADVLILAGFAFDKTFGRQIIWKILAVPYIILNIVSLFFCSEEFLEITHLNLLFSSYVVMIASVIVYVIFGYIIFRYAFTDDVYKAETSEN